MLTSGSSGTPSNLFLFKLDGVVKTLTGPVTGDALYTIAGDPARLESADGVLVKKGGDLIDFHGEEMEFVTKHSLGNMDELNPEHTLDASVRVVDPPHSQIIQELSPEEADEVKKEREEKDKAEDERHKQAATPKLDFPNSK